MVRNVTYDRRSLVELCQRHGVRKLSFFGSVLRGDFDPVSSDVDVLVEFDPEAEAGLTYFKLGAIAADLEDLLGRRIDLSLRDNLLDELRDTILATAEVQYARA
ncbi:MAG: nucleotidyltransferase family protein [Phycisphaeraceae bacterium]